MYCLVHHLGFVPYRSCKWHQRSRFDPTYLDGKPLYCRHPRDSDTPWPATTRTLMVVAMSLLNIPLMVQLYSLSSSLLLDCSLTALFFSFQC